MMYSFLVKKARCLAMFATHYHSLVEEWGNHPEVQTDTVYIIIITILCYKHVISGSVHRIVHTRALLQ
jgi:hypothetical protein